MKPTEEMIDKALVTDLYAATTFRESRAMLLEAVLADFDPLEYVVGPCPACKGEGIVVESWGEHFSQSQAAVDGCPTCHGHRSILLAALLRPDVLEAAQQAVVSNTIPPDSPDDVGYVMGHPQTIAANMLAAAAQVAKKS